MRKYLAALVVATPFLASCADAPSAPLLDPQVSFAISNPPPPPVAGFGFGFTSSETAFAASRLAAPLALLAPENDGASASNCLNGVGSLGACFPATFFQNGPGTNAWINFTNDVPKLPKDIAKAFDCPQSPGRVQFTDGETKGTGCAWAFVGSDIILIDLRQFTGAGNSSALVRDNDGSLQCASIGDPNGSVAAMRISSEGAAQPINLIFFQFQQSAGVFDDAPCGGETPTVE